MTEEGRRAAKNALGLGNAALAARRIDEAEEQYWRALALAESLPDPGMSADIHFNLGSVAWFRDDFDEAQARYSYARDRYADIEAWWHVAGAEQHLGNVAFERGELHRARWYFRRALTIYESKPEDPLTLADCRVNLAAALVELGQGAEALQQTDLASAAYRTNLSGSDRTRKLAECAQNSGFALMELGRHDEARVRWRNASRTFAALRDERKLADLDVDLGNLERRRGDMEAAEGHFRAAEAFYRHHDLESDLANCLLGRGSARLDAGDPAGARQLFTAAADIYSAHGQHDALARAHHDLGLSLAEEPASALRHLVPAWWSMRAITWGLPEVAARAAWRARTAQAAQAVLEAAQRLSDPVLIAEVVEAQRATTLIPTAPVIAGISSPASAADDLSAGVPPEVTIDGESRVAGFRQDLGVGAGFRTEEPTATVAVVVMLAVPRPPGA